MSRTLRRSPDEHDHRYYKEAGDIDYLRNDGRDGKDGNKPTGKWKRLRRRIRRAKVKQAMRNGKNILPVFKRCDMWDWN